MGAGAIFSGEVRRPERLRRERAKLFRGGIVQAEMGGNRFAFMHGPARAGCQAACTRFHNGFMEQSSRKRRGHQRQHALRAGRLAKSVMFSGSPPNAAMLSRTHSRAWI